MNDYTLEDAKSKFDVEYNKVYNCVNDLVNTNFAGYEVTTTDIVLGDTRNDYEIVNDKEVKAKRYSVSRSITIHTTEVENAQKLRDDIETKLITDTISTYATVSWVNFSYPDIGNIKPKLLEESYIEAHKAAEQFAKDSGQKLGKLKTADQGYVELSPGGYFETARIVTNATFYIK